MVKINLLTLALTAVIYGAFFQPEKTRLAQILDTIPAFVSARKEIIVSVIQEIGKIALIFGVLEFLKIGVLLGINKR